MVKNVNKFGKTETGLVSALHNFGRNLNYSSRVLKCSRRRGNQIPVQPTAIARRKSIYSGRKTQVGGRPVKRALPPALKEHTYGIFSELPKKHRKTKHSLTHCVEKNVSLPN
ncbi:hypothetical protein HNY73_007656 [Argiope bruennichi]|uniref:Uncharacterized protein n=2 Tax=Argiope bruennichi TaxID=94029 RepID=A0A8T0FEJ8_ARGBR|nr:hypothetical protein HNY73_007656 [Argiope bruennichi]